MAGPCSSEAAVHRLLLSSSKKLLNNPGTIFHLASPAAIAAGTAMPVFVF
jgi:hypothetical protein